MPPDPFSPAGRFEQARLDADQQRAQEAERRKATKENRAPAAWAFEDRGKLANVGRNSIPKSHRGEGFNCVD